MFGPRPDSAQRTDIHNTSTAELHHLPGPFLTAEEDGLYIDIVDEVPIGLTDLERVNACKPRCIVHQTIDQAELLSHLLKHTADARHVSKIGLEDRRSLAVTCCLFGFFT